MAYLSEGRYYIKYKCRNCGKIFVGGETEYLEEEECVENALKDLSEKRKIAIHRCGNNDCGIGDICGLWYDSWLNICHERYSDSEW